MNTIEQLKDTLTPILELTGIEKDEYLIIGSAAEFLAGLGVVFGDVDLYISPKTFKRLVGNHFQYEISHETDTPTKIIRIGMVDIIEHNEDWLEKERNTLVSLPILGNPNLIEWRICTGRQKDQLKAFQLCHRLYSNLRTVALNDPPLSALVQLKAAEEMIFGFQQRLMEMRK